MTRRYPAYGDSGVEWLGEVPAGWALCPLGRLTSKIGSGKTPNGGAETYLDEGVVFVRSQNVYDDGLRLDEVVCISKKTDEEMSNSRVHANDILLNITGASLGRTCVVPDGFPPANVNQHVCILRLKDLLSVPFVAMALKSPETKMQIASCLTGAARDGLNFEQVADIELILPSLPEQTAIAAFLDRETAKIDGLVAEQRRLIGLLGEKRQAVISLSVTKGLNPKAPLKPSGIDWLGDVPEAWEVCSLKHVTHEKCDGPFGSGLKSDHYTDEGTRVIRLQNIKAIEFNDGDAAFIDSDYASTELMRHEVRAGDLLIAGLGDDRNLVGRACVAPTGIEPAMVKADCFRFRLNPHSASAQFVAFQLNVSAHVDAGRMANGTTRSRIPLSQMAERSIALPPTEEQMAIASHVSGALRTFDTLTTTAESAIALLQERRAALISAAVTGKIDVRPLMAEGSQAA